MFDLAGESDHTTSELRAAAQALVAVDTTAATDTELMSTVLGIEAARRLLDAAQCAALAELDARGSTDLAEGMRTDRWLAHHAELPASVASARVKVGRSLRSTLPDVAEQLAEGRIGFEHARVLAEACSPRIEEPFAAAAALLAEGADGCVFDVWRREVAAFAALLDQDGPHDPGDDVTRNRLSKATALEGSHRLRAELVGLHGETVFQTIDAIADELFHRFHRDEQQCSGELRCPSRATLEALALVEMARRARSVDLDATTSPATDVTVVVNAEQPTTAHTGAAVPLQDGTTRHLRCDGRLLPIVVDSLGVPLDLGRAIRFANRAQRRAMSLRDGGCIFPGCTNPPTWCDAHHLDEWADGGRSDVTRMASLCRHHHMVVHRTGWELHAHHDGTFWFRTPQGRTFWGQQHGRQVCGPTPGTG
jgi:hypothetical protein